MIIEYTIKKGFKPDKKTLKDCRDGTKAWQALMVESARVTQPKNVFVMWLLTRFYRQEITDHSIRTNFYVLGWLMKKIDKVKTS